MEKNCNLSVQGEFEQKLQNSIVRLTADETRHLSSLINPCTGYEWLADISAVPKEASSRSITIRLRNRPYLFHSLKNIASVTELISPAQHLTLDGWSLIEDREAAETLIIAVDSRGSVQTGQDDSFNWHAVKEQDCIQVYGEPGPNTGHQEIYLITTHGDLDDSINRFREFLQTYVLPPLTSIDPMLSYNVWYTDDAAERLYLEDADFAAWMGFDVFTIDASWNEGGSVVPATNDWGSGLGSYKESLVKFPGGIRYLSDKVHEKGLKFGLWVDPQNVDSRRVSSGEIPQSWIARIDGQDLQCDHPTLSLMTEICLGNSSVVDWLKQELSRVISQWNVDWIKWDPSGTASYRCNREDHGHGKNDGAKAYFDGRREIMEYLMQKFPRLNGWECIFDTKTARVNPVENCYGYILPAYVNQFVTGPMVGPHVWGSMEYACGTRDSALSLPIGGYYEASYLDYFFRSILAQGGLSMGNITGMVSQRLKNAPLGYNDAFKRNMMQYKQYRHLYTQDSYRSRLLADADQWRAVQYVGRNASESLLYVFRDGSTQQTNHVKLRGLDESGTYTVASLNQRPGKERVISGRELMTTGLDVSLPNPYLATANYSLDRMAEATRKAFEAQLKYGSDVLTLIRA